MKNERLVFSQRNNWRVFAADCVLRVKLNQILIALRIQTHRSIDVYFNQKKKSFFILLGSLRMRLKIEASTDVSKQLFV